MAECAIDLAIAEHLTARLCHELASSVGAISNGLELIEDEPEFGREAARLIGDSARTAARRLQFYRAAYGATAGLTDERARAVTLELLAEGKIACDWPADLAVPENWPKLVCNLLLLACETLPRGGRVALVAGGAAQGGTIAAIAAGEGARFQSPLPEIIANRAAVEDVTPRSVQAAFTAALARRLGARIELRQSRADELALVVV